MNHKPTSGSTFVFFGAGLRTGVKLVTGGNNGGAFGVFDGVLIGICPESSPDMVKSTWPK